jgi:hypothetical protein
MMVDRERPASGGIIFLSTINYQLSTLSFSCALWRSAASQSTSAAIASTIGTARGSTQAS